MSTLSLSLWLPISRANFYSFTESDWLELRSEGEQLFCSSNRLARQGYVPLMLVGVLRRILEVMPTSFGYACEGVCGVRGDSKARQRPVNVAMTLHLVSGGRPTGASERRANALLALAGVSRVTLHVDENGSYAFTATYDKVDAEDQVRAALIHHIREVFGGDYVVHPLPVSNKRRFNTGDASLKAYNGLRDVDGKETVEGPPRGALNFGQLHILAEGLWNDMLSPAVYLEQQDFMEAYLAGTESDEFLRSVADVIGAVTTDADASTAIGQIAVLHHFLTITSNGSLQKLKSALESVRRRLLDEMMGTLHRQTRLVQLNFSANARERTPELAVGATESQLKGYATLVSAKLPLILGVREMARLAKEHLEWVVTSGPSAVTRSESDTAELMNQLSRLDGQVRHWNVLLDDLSENVRSLENTIEHAWMDRLLYEQEQVRSEQEAMAEIERSRQSRPMSQQAGRSAYNLVMMLLAAAAVVVTVTTSNLQELGRPGTGWWQVVVALWPVWAVAVLAYGVIPAVGHLRRASKERRGVLLSYPYEFAFGLDENVDPEKLRAHVGATKRRKLRTLSRRKLSLTNRGYGRIERMSPDTTLVKIHTVVAFHVRFLRYARFEVISEILIHKIATSTQHVLVQCRIFGESPLPLKDNRVIDLLKTILVDLGRQIATDEDIDVDTLIEESLYRAPHKVAELPGQRGGAGGAAGDAVRAGARDATTGPIA